MPYSFNTANVLMGSIYLGQQLARTNGQKELSTDEENLIKLRHLHPLPNIILEHRMLSKLMSTYLGMVIFYYGKVNNDE